MYMRICVCVREHACHAYIRKLQAVTKVTNVQLLCTVVHTSDESTLVPEIMLVYVYGLERLYLRRVYKINDISNVKIS